MQQMFGSSFATIYGEVPSPIWEAAIAKLTDDECRTGLSSIAKEARQYPVNLTEFVEACRPKSPGPRYLGRPVNPSRLLERQKAPEDVRQKYLASMRALFGKSEPEPEPERLPHLNPQLAEGCTCKAQGTCDTCVAWANHG